MAVTYGAECLVLLVKWFAGSQKRRYPLGRVPTQMAWTRSLSATLVAPAWGWLWVTGERALPRARLQDIAEKRVVVNGQVGNCA